MLLKSVKFRNFLSFGDTAEEIPLQNLNVIIGPNASGKSNFLRGIGLLRGFHRNSARVLSNVGRDLVWKGVPINSIIEIEAVLSTASSLKHDIRHLLRFTKSKVIEEKIEAVGSSKNKKDFPIYCHYKNGMVTFNINVPNRDQHIVNKKYVSSKASILSQFRDPERMPEINKFIRIFGAAEIYAEWGFGADKWARTSAILDMDDDDVLDSNASNLALVLKRLSEDKKAKDKLLEHVKHIYNGAEKIKFKDDGNKVSLVIREKGIDKAYDMPAFQLSDGTMRYLSLLAILCDPDPPPLICIEEPELGMHPDIIPTIADLLIDASKRCQIIVTTHSEILLDAFSETPEHVLVAEKDERGTHITRLDADTLKDSLEDGHRLGDLWSAGELGGNRW